jgi:hypothetical protein
VRRAGVSWVERRERKTRKKREAGGKRKREVSGSKRDSAYGKKKKAHRETWQTKKRAHREIDAYDEIETTRNHREIVRTTKKESPQREKLPYTHT